MKVDLNSFRGQVPRLTPRALPDNAAQTATNARLQSGDLETWRQFSLVKSLSTPANVDSIYLLDDAWLEFGEDADVARGAVPGDASYTAFITAPSLYTEPRFTNYSMATTGSGTLPVTTRPLGVPAPESAATLTVGVDDTPTTFSVNILDDNASLDDTWSVGGESSEATITQETGAYQIAYTGNRSAGEDGYVYRDFGIAGAAVVKVSFDFEISGDNDIRQAVMNVACNAEGAGLRVSYRYSSNGGSNKLWIMKATQWGAWHYRAVIQELDVGTILSTGVTYTLEVTAVTNSDSSKTVTARIMQASSEIATTTATSVFSDGDYCGFANGTPNDAQPSFITQYSNFYVRASGSLGYVPSNLATSYVYTFVNDLGWESAPSPVSATIVRPDGVSVAVVTATAIPSGVSSAYQIETKRIYRAVTGNTGTDFLFVAEIALATASYSDTLTDAALGESLESDDWDLPPDDLKGLIALPNGILAGFRRNQLCFSVQNRPHAWPGVYRLNTDTDIVAIGNIDTTVVIGTESFPYLAIGSDPAAYSMTKLEVPQACVSKRSLAYLTGIGVVFASPDGLIAVAGNGIVRNLTKNTFTRRQWQALRPTSILGVAHDDSYFFWYETAVSGERGGYVLDAGQDGFGLVPLSFHATAAHADPLTDALYLVLDDSDEPDSVYLPTSSTQPTPTGTQIHMFDSPTGSGAMRYQWRGKLHLLPRPTTFMVAKVEAQDYTNLVMKLYADGVAFYEDSPVNDEPFTLPAVDTYREFEIELIGTSRVRQVQVAEQVEELD